MKIKLTEYGKKELDKLDEKFENFKRHVYHNEMSEFEHLVNYSRFYVEYDMEFDSVGDLCNKAAKKHFECSEEMDEIITKALCKKIIEIL